MNSTISKPDKNGTPNVPSPTAQVAAEPAVRKTRTQKPRAPGLRLTLNLTDPKEIEQITELAAKDRRTPENYLSLLLYEHLQSNAPIERFKTPA